MSFPHALQQLVGLVREPASAATLSAGDWPAVISLARTAGILGKIHHSLEQAGQEQHVHPRALNHLRSARLESRAHNQYLLYDLETVAAALKEAEIPVIALKGVAYAAAGLEAAEGRTYADMDILVPKAQLPQAEKLLFWYGWRGRKVNRYDDYYYRVWSHEIPPLHHIQRYTVLDLHHAILPVTHRHSPDPTPLLQDARPVTGMDNLFVLKPADMVIHSAAHLFYEGEFHNSLRDLMDLHSLLLQFTAEDSGFVPELLARCSQLGMGRTLFYALRYMQHFFATPLPEALVAGLMVHAPGERRLRRMDRLFDRALRPMHPDGEERFSGASRLALFMRAHYLRMPLWILLPHLLYKSSIAPMLDAYEAWKEEREAADA